MEHSIDSFYCESGNISGSVAMWRYINTQSRLRTYCIVLVCCVLFYLLVFLFLLFFFIYFIFHFDVYDLSSTQIGLLYIIIYLSVYLSMEFI